MPSPGLDLQQAARDHLWLHFTRMGGYDGADVPIIVRGEGCHLFDANGKRYLDALAGLFAVQIGYSYGEEMGQAALEQMRELPFYTNWSYAHPRAIELAHELASLAPGDLNRVFFVSGGSEAVESIWKLARQYHAARGERRWKVVARRLAYHGTTMGALSINGIPALRAPFEPLVPDALHVRNTNRYHRPPDETEAEFTAFLLEDLHSAIEQAGPETVALVIMEPVQNAGGSFTPPAGYFEGVREICDRYGILLCADEVITAFGRLGEWFGSERYDIRPDLVTCAKGLSSAYAAIGAVIASDRVMEPFLEGKAMFTHGITFGGHPVQAAIALKNLEIMKRERIVEHVRANEAALRTTLEPLLDLPIVGDLRGCGYFWALELVKDKGTRESFGDEDSERLLRGFLSGRLFERGLICRADDRGDPVVQISPPLVAGQAEFDELAGILGDVLAEAWQYMDSRKGGGVTTYEADLEQTTALALEEKSKLIKSLRRFDMVFFTVCAFVGLDTLGAVASNGPQGFFWLVALALLFVLPYALLMAEAGSTFTEEGGPYEWMKLAWGRFVAGIGAILYWVTNPLWVGGSLAFIAAEAWDVNVSGLGQGTWGDYFFKLLFIWISIGVAIASLRYGKWIPNLGAFLRFFTLGFFSITVVVYGIEHGFHGFSAHDVSPSRAVFIAFVPVLLFNYVGFELQNGAAEEMENPSRDVPVSVFQAAVLGVLSYVIPILGILLVLPLDQVTGIGGFIDAVTEVFSVYGGAAHALLILMTLGFIGSLVTSGAVWMIGSDRVQAVAAYDGAFWGWFGVFNRRLGTPVRVNVMSGIVSTIFCVVAIAFFNSGADSTFAVVLTIAISTTLLSYCLIFPAILKLRYNHGHVKRPYTFPFGRAGVWAGTVIVTFWVLLGSWVAVFPGTLEPLLGVDYGSFQEAWGVSRAKYEVYTLGTLGVVVLIGVLGYVAGAPTRRRVVTVPIGDASLAAAEAEPV